MTLAFEVRDLHFSYKHDTEVLKGLSFGANFGRITGLLGPNGSGKSTSFKILSTQITPSRGEAFVCGVNVVKEASMARRRLGVTFQSPSLDPMLTIGENLEIYAALMGLSKREARSRIERRLKDLSVWDRRDSRVKELSGGLARRAELAKTLVADPDVLLLDEPTTGLDPSSRREFWRVLGDLVSPKTAILVTTHLMEEAELCQDLIFIADGAVAAHGSPESLKQDFGAEVLLLECADPANLHSELARVLGPSAKISLQGNVLRVEGSGLAGNFESVRARFAAQLTGFQWSRGTLADIYFRKTGKELVAS